ncbi:MAG TPA: QsdR family transcriptional regulator [Candidatus Dormibacteraeota bacterium]
MATATQLERHLSGHAQRRGPLDALDEGRRRFLRGDRLDMGDLAADLGISRATLYRWVGDRERLLGEILWSFAQRGLAESRAHADGRRLAGADWVVAYVAHNMRLTASFEPIKRFMEREPDAALRVLTSKHGVQQSRLIDALRAVLEEKGAAGELALPIDPADLAYAIVRISESFIWREFITGEEPDLDKAVQVVRLLLAGCA